MGEKMRVKIISNSLVLILLSIVGIGCLAGTSTPTIVTTNSLNLTPEPTQLVEASPIQPQPIPTSYRISLHEQCRKIVDGLYELRKDLAFPEKFSTEEPTRNDFGFDPNQYFQIFTHLSLEDNYVLDYIYYKNRLGGLPLIYARETKSLPFQTFNELLASYGEDLSDTGLIVYTNLPHQFDFIDKIQIDNTPESFFEFAIFPFQSGQFYLWERGLYRDEKVLCDSSDIKYLIEDAKKYNLELPQILLKMIEETTVSPIAIINEDKIAISYFIFTKWIGLYQEKIIFDKKDPMHIIDLSRTTWFEYHSGIQIKP